MKMMKNIAYAAAAGFLLLGGCTQPQNASLLSGRSTVDVVQNTLDNVPFAYDLAVDTISYNSCVGSELNRSDLHGIKLGVNEGFVDSNGTGAVKGGLKLRSDFLSFVGKNLQPNYPLTTISTEQIQFLLKNSQANQGLYVQYGVRTAADLKLAPDTIQPSTAPQQGRDGIYEYASLSEDPIVANITKEVKFNKSGNVLAEGPRIFNVGTAASPKAFEASFGYSNYTDETFAVQQGVDDNLGAGEEYSDRVRTKFSAGTYVLAVTFGSPTTGTTDSVAGLDSPKRALANSADLTKAYGRAYALSFTTKNSSIPSWRKNILNRVVEKNLEDGRQVSGVSWTCDNVLIMKTNQLNNKKAGEPACSELQASDMLNAGIAAQVKNIRRHYPQSSWAIGLYYAKNAVYNPALRLAAPRLCLVNKSIDCYLPTTGLIASNPTEDVGVQYDETQECYLSRYVNMGVTYIGNKSGDTARRLGRCPQYASICVRSSTSY